MDQKILKYIESGDWHLVVRKSNDANWLYYAELWEHGAAFNLYEGCGDDVIRVTQVSYNATADKSLNLPGNCVILL